MKAKAARRVSAAREQPRTLSMNQAYNVALARRESGRTQEV